MKAKDALLAIQEVMSGKEWDADTLDAIRDIMDAAGYEIKDTNGEDEGDEL